MLRAIHVIGAGALSALPHPFRVYTKVARMFIDSERFLAPFLLYTDPGTGALVWQILAAGMIGALFYVRKVKDWFLLKRLTKKGGDSPPLPLVPRGKDTRL